MNWKGLRAFVFGFLGVILGQISGVHSALGSSVHFFSSQDSPSEAYFRGNHSRYALVTSQSTLRAGESAYVGIHIKLDPDWHTYWIHPGDSGSGPTVKMSAPSTVNVGELRWPCPYRIPTPPLVTFGYENEVVFFREIKALPDHSGAAEILVEAEWLVCKEICVPEIATLRLVFRENAESKIPTQMGLFQSVLKQEMSPVGWTFTHEHRMQSDLFRAQWPGDLELKNLEFFPFLDSGLSTDVSAFVQTGAHEGQWSLKRSTVNRDSTSSAMGHGMAGLVIAETSNGRSCISVRELESKGVNLMKYLIFALIGGLILNLMPCVFPVLSIKVLSLVKFRGLNQKDVLIHVFLYGLGVLASFNLLGGLVALLRASGEQIGWGFQLQSPAFVVFLIIIFVGLGFNFLNVYQFSNIPGPKWIQSLTHGDGKTSAFFSGVMATVVASPCTAPFLGAAMGFALSQPMGVIFLLFSVMGLGMSLPFLVLGLIPRLLTWLPKPGAWMETMRKFMALPMFGTALWLGWIILSPQLDSSKTDLLPWEPFEVETLDDSFMERVTFVNFTAAWCLTCQVNDRTTFRDQSVVDYVIANKIRVVKADWTKKDPSITAFLEQHGRVGVPFYILYPRGKNPTAILLPELLTPTILINALEKANNSSSL